MKNKYVAAVLAFVLGSIGVHKFYLRDPGAGIFYIMLMVMTSRFMPISAILGIIDGMRYLMMSPEDFDKKFNGNYYQTRPKASRRNAPTNREYYEVKKAPSTPRSRTIVRNNPFKKSGLKKYKEFEIEEAIDDFKKGLKIEPNDIALHFNLACAYSLLENKEDAFTHLALAVENGFKDFDKIQSHDDLAFLRIQPEFDDYKEKGYKMIPNPVAKETEEQRPMDDVLLSQLNRLMELRKKGVLTENEFVFERKKILARD